MSSITPFRRAAIGLAALGLCACASPGAPFETATRAGYDFIDFPAAGPDPAILTGRLVRPEGAVKGAVILSHGAAGTGGRQVRAAEAFAEEGFAALILDHFTARGVRSVARDQIRISEQQMAADLFASRDAVAAELGLKAAKIGAVGWSKGATSAVLASVDRLMGYVGGGGAPLAYAAAFYPFCGFQLDEDGLANPLLLLLAGEDDWTPSAPCIRQAEAWNAAGEPIDWVVYPDAEHGFDSGVGRLEIGGAITVRDSGPACALRVDVSGRTVTLDGGHDLTTPEAREAYLETCGVRGVTFAGDDAAGADAIARLLAFVRDQTP